MIVDFKLEGNSFFLSKSWFFNCTWHRIIREWNSDSYNGI